VLRCPLARWPGKPSSRQPPSPPPSHTRRYRALACPHTPRGHIVPPCPAHLTATSIWTNFLLRRMHASLCRSPPRCTLCRMCTLALRKHVRVLATTPCHPIHSQTRAYKRTPLPCISSTPSTSCPLRGVCRCCLCFFSSGRHGQLRSPLFPPCA
jgi:hypothetical protein